MATPKTPGRRVSGRGAASKDPAKVEDAETVEGATATPDPAAAPDPAPSDPAEPAIWPADPQDEGPQVTATETLEPVDPAAPTATDDPGTDAAPDAGQPEAPPAPEVAAADAPETNGNSTVPPAPTVAAPAAPARSGGGFFALFLGGVAAAVLGFVMARYVLPEGWPIPGASPLQAQIERQATEIQTLRDQVASLNFTPDLSPVEADIATLRTDLAEVREAAEAARHAAATAANTPADPPAELIARLDDVAARLDTLESRPAQPDGVAAAEDVAGLEAAIAALRDGLAAQEARTAAAAEAARAEVAQMQAEAEAARLATEAEADSTLQQAALAQIEAALLSGAPYADSLAALVAAGHDSVPVLTENAESGLPTLAGLTERFDEPARAAIAAELRSDMGATVTDRIGSFLRAQTGARSLSPREGTDADAVLSRAEAALRALDLDRALAELQGLSEPARAEMAGWVVQAERHRDAAAALAALGAAVTER